MNAPRSQDIRRLGLWLFLLTLGVYVFTAGGSLTSSDAVATYGVTESLVERHSVALSTDIVGFEGYRGPDGRYYSPFGIGQSVYNIPFYLAAKAVIRATGLTLGKPDSVPKAVVAMSRTLLCALIVWLTFALCVEATRSVTMSLLAAATLAFGSVIWPYARFGFNQPLACVLLLAAVSDVYRGVRGESSWAIARGGAWLGLGILTRHELMLAAPILIAWMLKADRAPARARVMRLLSFMPGLAAGIALWLAYNVVRFGNPVDSGQLRDSVEAFWNPVGAGINGLLFSPSASVFLYSPFALFGLVGIVILFRKNRGLAILLASLFAGFLVFYGTLGNWVGGRSYGSRYLLIILPYLAVGWAALLSRLGQRSRSALFLAVFASGVLVQLPGVLVDYAKVSQLSADAAGHGFSTQDHQWLWAASGLALNARAAETAVPGNLAFLLGSKAVPAVARASGESDRGFSQQFAFSLDFWWLYLFYFGALSRTAVAAIVLSASAWVAFCGVQIRRAASACRMVK